MNPTFTFTLKGITPLLVHADDIDQADRLTEWRNDPNNKRNSKAGDDRSPAWTWQTYCYTDGKQLVIPTDNIQRCLIAAATEITLKKQKSMKEVAASGLYFHEIFIPIVGPKGIVQAKQVAELADLSFFDQREQVKSLGFTLFAKRARIGTVKHVRVRPRFDQWSLSGTVEITQSEIGEDHLRKMFAIAGMYKGLCDWRPSSKIPGPFGKFEATLEKVK